MVIWIAIILFVLLAACFGAAARPDKDEAIVSAVFIILFAGIAVSLAHWGFQ